MPSLCSLRSGLVAALCLFGSALRAVEVGEVTEFPLDWPGSSTASAGSTHELTFNPNGGKVIWVTGQNFDSVARVTLDGAPTFFAMPKGSGPHGIRFDAAGNLWVTLEFIGEVVRLDQETGAILERIDVHLFAKDSPAPINTHPHGLGVGPDGKTLWFTGKLSNTVGRINPDHTVEHFVLPTVGAVPIYIEAGPDGNMWCTELVGNQIARVTPAGVVKEFAIPTYNSRPIAIVPGSDGKSMWFSEEAGDQVARIALDGTIDEFPVPITQHNVILAGLTFDRDGRLWTQSYVDSRNPYPEGPDSIVRFAPTISTATKESISNVPIVYYEVPTRDTVMHRIIQGPDGAIWFTELNADNLGRVRLIEQKAAPANGALKAKPPPKLRRVPEFCG
jgi:virginiamycin B lyase